MTEYPHHVESTQGAQDSDRRVSAVAATLVDADVAYYRRKRMRFNTKIAVLLRADLPVWQKLNVTAFLASGIAATSEGVIGEPYGDASDRPYLPMFRQPVLVFGVTQEQLRSAYERAMARHLQITIFTDQLFTTNN